MRRFPAVLLSSLLAIALFAVAFPPLSSRGAMATSRSSRPWT